MKKSINLKFLKIISTTGLMLSPSLIFAADGYRLFPDLLCKSDGSDALTCFVARVWAFSQTAILVLAVAGFVIAGIIYMTSAGNPKQIEMTKKIIIGALSAIAVMILGRFFLTNVVGVPWL
ncbi:MAG: hypothetical protein PHU86_04335 [Patescibacteria group bacterium]|nr:hypothetical protein [Patescibacteria group bacterium]